MTRHTILFKFQRHVAFLLFLLVVLPLLLMTANAAAGGEGPGEAELIEDRMMVRVPADAPDYQAALLAFIEAFLNDPANAKMTLQPIEGEEIPGRGIFLLELSTPPGTDFDLLEERLKLNYTDLIAWAELLYDNDAPEGSEGSTGSTFVDSIDPGFFNSQYSVDHLGLPAAQSKATGNGVAVAVLDTGIDTTHPIFAGRILPNGYNFVDGNTNVDDVGDSNDSDGDGDIDEMVGHGTFVSGLISLVAPDVKLLPIRVLDGDGRGNHWLLTRAMYYAIDQGVEVINVSIRSTYESQGVEEAILEARSLGIITVGAAGNFDSNRDEYPATTDFAFGVAALDDLDIKADFSSYNKDLFISAPGDTVYSNGQPDMDRAIVSALPGGDYGIWEGTSMAAPLVAGAVALIRSQEPTVPLDEFGNLVTGRLATTAVYIYDVNPQYEDEAELGVGRIAIGDAVDLGPVAPAPADLDGSGSVGTADLLQLLSDWGLTHTPADLDHDGVVGTADLLLLLGSWG